jgi:chromosome segregation protein
MLRALELVGFKSFADKTRLDFPPGITVVVGPNGSGKSNVVDAIKWVLGEQSVKSLRGKEMADVIFNGSSSRRPLNSAEVTLTFDNADGRLPLETPEVHITRRVYRSGEGEYLINKQPARLRDIRDLFAGTGVATEAYSVIEQGKVDVLLQSSPKDRRMIFEEAAGISRFKAKKIETQRRLERVEQNLLRLSDIVDEVESRLRAARMQATKARRYQEYAARLQELRTQVGLTDWRKLTAQLEALEGEIRILRDDAAQTAGLAERGEQQAVEIDGRIGEVDTLIRTSEARIAQNRERIAALEAALDSQRTRIAEYEQQAARLRRQIAAMRGRAGDLDANLAAAQAAIVEADARRRELGGRLADEERAFTALAAQVDQIRSENEQRRAAQLDEMRAGAALAGEIKSLDAQLARAEERRQSCLARLAQLDAERLSAGAQIARLEAERERLYEHVEVRNTDLAAARKQLADSRQELALRQQELASCRERLTGAVERAAVLTELENRLEGVSAGVKEVLQLARDEPKGPFGQVRGMLADLLHAAVESAALVEVALGERAQSLVVQPGERLRKHLAAEPGRWQGRVAFLPLEGGRDVSVKADFAGQPGVIGRASQFVEAPADLAPLVDRLLGDVWFVENLAAALALLSAAEQSTSFVTLSGELLAADGTLIVGPIHSTIGLISRRSELRALKQQITESQHNVAAAQQAVTQLEAGVNKREQHVDDLAAAHQQAAAELAELRLQLGAAEQKLVQQREQERVITEDARGVTDQCQAIIQARTITRGKLEQVQGTLAQTEARLAENARRIEQLDAARQTRSREAMTVKLELARYEQQIDHLHAEIRRFEQERSERQRSLIEGGEQLLDYLRRSSEAEGSVLAVESELADLYLRKDSFGGETTLLAERREELRGQRAAATHEAQRLRARFRRLEERLHKRELDAGALRHERTALEERLREDYGIELSEQTQELTADAERAAVEEEIADLRRKLTNIGGVNLDSLQEADELEQRFTGLSEQFQDLTKAKASLETIIGKINADSRRLFAETLDTVKEHFQTLFRKLFGGGRADILLEEGIDILDSGIEILARPPGKEPRSISLLSGGEKTLTCVALLLAIFRSRPSPFCVLDEVDAALDEANIERFVAVLNEFLQWTQFIVVTHSKKTMACAGTLYGITMQESGISKRVSVRFEDVSDNGEIAIEAVNRSEEAA